MFRKWDRVLKIQLFVLLSFLLWASSNRNQTFSTLIVSILPSIFYSWLTNLFWVRNSVKTVQFRPWKFQVQKLKMGQSMIFQFVFEILTFSTSISQFGFMPSSINWLIGLWAKYHPICQMCVQKMGQSFENTTFRFVKLSAVSFLRSN